MVSVRSRDQKVSSSRCGRVIEAVVMEMVGRVVVVVRAVMSMKLRRAVH